MSSDNEMNKRNGQGSKKPNRREFLAWSTGAAAMAAMPKWLPRVNLARSHRTGQRDVLVAIFLRGGADGLVLCAPYGDPQYYTVRGLNAVPQPNSGSSQAALDLDGFFGLHPALSPLWPAWQAGHVRMVHAVGAPNPSRSHFEKERVMEVGDATGSGATGWIGRHLANVSPLSASPMLRGVGVRPDLPYSLGGAPQTLPIPAIETFGLYGSPSTETARKACLNSMYSRTNGSLRSAALDSLATMNLLSTINFSGYAPANGANYPLTGSYASFGQSLKSTAALIKAQVGVETVAIDLRDWDTHGSQGTFGGTFHGLATALGQGLGAFWSDMTAPNAPGVSVVVMTEFGRRVVENGSGGTDHGYGGCMMLVGNGGIQGGVTATWPGLAPAQRFEGIDLAITTDYRDILAEIVQVRLGNTNLGAVFPGYTPTFRGVTHP